MKHTETHIKVRHYEISGQQGKEMCLYVSRKANIGQIQNKSGIILLNEQLVIKSNNNETEQTKKENKT